MSKLQKIHFSFDERSFESMEKLITQGSHPHGSTNADDYEEIVVRHPETGEVRIIVIPKNDGKRCDKCGQKIR